MTTIPRPIDYDVRQQALDTSHSYAVAAPAGSGKTGLLTLRLLKLLCLCERPEEILCITFTRKAAAEMRERLLHALNHAFEPLATDASEHAQLTQQFAQQALARDSEKNWNIQTAPGRLRIQTIDSFCRSLASQLPVASALGADLATLDDPAQAYRLAVQRLLEDYAKQGEAHQDLEVLIRHLDNQLNRLEELLVALLANRDQWMGLLFAVKFGDRETLEASMGQWADELVDKTAADLAPFAGELLECIRYAAGNLADSHPGHELLAVQELAGLPGADDQDIIHYWRPIINLLLTTTGGWRKRLDKNCGFVPGTTKDEKATAKARKQQFTDLLKDMQERPSLLENLTELRSFPGAQYSETEWALLRSLTAVLPRLVAELKLVFRQLGATDFVEMTEAALTALGSAEDPTDLALKLDYRIQHILVDEFQDTATPQLSLLEKLTEGWQPDDGRTLFVVGDGMQSCYGFRDANVGIFLDIRAHGLPAVALEALDLKVNFRSRSGIVAWVNRVFESAFPQQDDIGRGAVRYAESHSADQRAAEDCVSCTLFAGAEDHAQEARFITEKIGQLRQTAPEDSVAILVRGRAHLREIVPALAAAGIPYRAVDIDPLLSRMAIVDLLSLTRALLDPSDRIAWLALLRAPWCGLDMHDLHVIATTDVGEQNPAPHDQNYPNLLGQLTAYEAIPGLSAHATEALSRLRTHLVTSWQERRRKPLRQWIEGTWISLGGPASAPTSADREDVQAFFRLLERFERAGTIPSWPEFESALAKLYAEPAPAADNPVELMTIHKSKGLEFDHVFLPGLDRRPRGDDSPLVIWHQRLTQQGDKHLIMSPITATEEETASPLYQFLMREKKIKNRLEETRLLYVACTRAKQQLWLTANAQVTEDGAIKPPPESCLLARIWPAIESEVTVIEAVSEQSPAAPKTPQPASQLRRLVASWTLPAANFTAPLAHWRGREYDNTQLSDAEDNPFHNRLARHQGTLWHRVFRRLAVDGLQHWCAERIAQQKPFWRAQARQLGLAPNDVELFCEQLDDVLARLRDDPEAHWVFDASHQDSHCEYALFSRGGGRQWVVDRTFVDDGRRWIIDFKTAEPAAGQTLDSFLEEQHEHYRQQLQSYSQAFRQMEQRPQSLALYFPKLGCLSVLRSEVTPA